ncbi:glycosyltransferase family 10 domain-containing protein [Pleomorphomonas sp. NRK KF1]|uniref:glycosyltransferase family 10 domain-containing protein n=1 Tax=Pleomorphomonas sp. NRK KF1 TaxID=2943000 RepID=UPI0020448DD2|nr:glycosyltransferase family 10 [Pleomorphomonas sp. NRK KF1]MCM5555136.1 glycosyltransferase family 10 [Pleomorphomonas sp. NRK KF1]
MTRVALSTQHDKAPFLRQTPNGNGRWGDFVFQMVPSQDLQRGYSRAVGDDWLVVYDNPHDPVETDLPRSRRVIVITEPPGLKNYYDGFLKQFGVMLSPFPVPGFEGRFIQTDVGLPWHIGLNFLDPSYPVPSRWTFEELEAMPVGEKQHRLSAVVSTKSKLPRHRRRVEFVLALAEQMGDQFCLFGRGFSRIEDKAEAILPYTHHLVIENNTEDSFFTEKTADAYLGWALPIFSGCKNINDFFPEDSMICFDLDSPDAVERVVAGFECPINQDRLAAIAEARRRVMHEANLFSKLADVLGGMDAPPPIRVHAVVLPNNDFKNARRRLKRRLWLLGRGFIRP